MTYLKQWWWYLCFGGKNKKTIPYFLSLQRQTFRWGLISLKNLIVHRRQVKYFQSGGWQNKYPKGDNLLLLKLFVLNVSSKDKLKHSETSVMILTVNDKIFLIIREINYLLGMMWMLSVTVHTQGEVINILAHQWVLMIFVTRYSQQIQTGRNLIVCRDHLSKIWFQITLCHTD